AGGRLDARQRRAIGMALERRAELAQRDQLLLREVAGPREHGVEGGHRVALREHDTVAVRPVRALGIVAQPPEVEGREDVDHRERSSGMAGARVASILKIWTRHSRAIDSRRTSAISRAPP